MKEAIIYGVRVRLKSESRLMRLINFFIKPFNKRFMTNYWTTVVDTVYAPSSLDAYINDESYYPRIKTIIEHEAIHISDYKKWKLLFALTYIFPPVIFAYGRWVWERKAYLPELIELYKRPTHDFDDRLERIVNSLGGPEYMWTWPKKWMCEWFLKEVRKNVD